VTFLFDTVLWPVEAVRSLVAEGGVYVVWIFACGILLWTLTVERIIYFTYFFPAQSRELLEAWRARPDHVTWCARQIRQAMISRLNAAMNANLILLKVLVPLSPLLGLVGTVSGMLEVFDSMALRGSADARTMASGVSHAMICTMTGLAVSLTGLYPVYYFQSRAKRETELLADRLAF
jgi:biopolymer transport protein ExbB